MTTSIYKRGDGGYGDWLCGSLERTPILPTPYWVWIMEIKLFSRNKFFGMLCICSKTFWANFSQVFILHMNDQKGMQRISKFLERLYTSIILLWKPLLFGFIK